MNTEQKLDWSKPIRVKDGRAARLLGKLKRRTSPYTVAIQDPSGYESLWSFPEEGIYGTTQLENVPEKHKLRLALYRDPSGKIWVNTAAAPNHSDYLYWQFENFVKFIEVEVEIP